MPVKLSDFHNNKSGNVAVIFSISASVILGVVALAITVGDAYGVRSKTQQALDTAVLAGASLGYESTDDERIATAQTIYNNNGTVRANGNAQLTVQQLPPAQFTTSDTMVFGDIQFTMGSPFLGVLGTSSLSLHVSSAAKKARGAPVCVLGLDPTEEATMDFNGQASLVVNNCATQANSTSGQGMHQVGHPNMQAKEIGVTGGYTGTAYSPAPLRGTNPIADPYASLPVPLTGTCHAMSGAKLQQDTLTLTPGTYCGGLDIKASSVVTLASGEYIFLDGPLTIDSQSTVRGREVMLAFLGPTSTLYLIGGATLNVTSPTFGTYKNIQFFGDRNVYAGHGGNGTFGNNLWFTVVGDSSLTFDGALYAPSFHVWFAGGSIIDGKSPSYIAVAKKLWFQDHTQVQLTQANTRGLTVDASAQLQHGASLFK